MKNNKHSKDIKLPLIGRVGVHHETSGSGVGDLKGNLFFGTNLQIQVLRNGVPLKNKETIKRWARFWNNIRANETIYNVGSGTVVYAGVRLMSQDTAVSAGAAALNVFKYHGVGTGVTASTSTDTALQTAIGTTATAGTNVNAGASPNATVTSTATVGPFGSPYAVTEWGLFNQATLSGATMFDHLVFAAINLAATTDTIVITFTLTLTSGS